MYIYVHVLAAFVCFCGLYSTQLGSRPVLRNLLSPSFYGSFAAAVFMSERNRNLEVRSFRIWKGMDGFPTVATLLISHTSSAKKIFHLKLVWCFTWPEVFLDDLPWRHRQAIPRLKVPCSGADSNDFIQVVPVLLHQFVLWVVSNIPPTNFAKKYGEGHISPESCLAQFLVAQLPDHWYRSWFFLSLQGLVSVSPGPPSQRNNFNLAKDVSIRFMPKASSYQQGFCSYWLWLHSSLGTITGRSVNAWRMVLGPLEWHIDGYAQPMILIFCCFAFLFSPPPKVIDSKSWKILVASNGQRVGSLLGRMLHSKVFILTGKCRKITTPWRAYFSIGWAQSLGKAAINSHHLIFSSPPRL